MMVNIVVLVSGGGTNLQAILDAQERGEIKNGKVYHVISSNPEAYALIRAKNHGVNSSVINLKTFASRDEFDAAIVKKLDELNAGLVVYAGFNFILGEAVTNKYANKMINVHPSLIPSFCGKGFYGLKVHQAVLDYGVKLTGATVHYVNEVCDGGKIIMQKAVPVLENDTTETLQKRVMEEAEWELLPKAINKIINK